MFGPTSAGGGESAAGGGLALPAFNNWHAGLTFSYQVFKLGLNYTDTSLSRENCFRNDRRPRRHSGRRGKSGRQSLGIALAAVRRDVLGDARFRIQSFNARPLIRRAKRPAQGRPLRSSNSIGSFDFLIGVC